ncbi:hypothetical protein D3C86_2039580 [compost metagenome]
MPQMAIAITSAAPNCSMNRWARLAWRNVANSHNAVAEASTAISTESATSAQSQTMPGAICMAPMPM